MHRFQEHPIVTCSINDLHSGGGRNTGSSYTIPAMSPRVERNWAVVEHVESRWFAAGGGGGANEFTFSTRSKVEIININGEAEIIPLLWFMLLGVSVFVWRHGGVGGTLR